MTRIFAALVAACLILISPAHAESYSTIILYKNSQVPLQGNPAQNWAWYENALTSSTQMLPANLMTGNARLIYARLIVVWNPNSAASSTGVEAVYCDGGPTNCHLLGAQVTGMSNPQNGPVPVGQDITTQLQSIIDAGIVKHLGFESFGNGSAGPLIYEVAIECVWQ